MVSTAVIERQRAREIVEGINAARVTALEGFRLLVESKEAIGAVLGKGYAGHYLDHLWDDRISDGSLRAQAVKTDQLIATNTWRYLLKVFGLYQYMTDARQAECEHQLARGAFPALTVENIQTTLEGLTNDMGRLLVETVTEVFDWLRPSTAWGRGALKTNTQFRVGYKVILCGALNSDSHLMGLRVNYFRDTHLRALGRVLSLLDGQGVPQYPDDLVTQLNQQLSTAHAGQELTLAYFTCRPRLNGNLAVTFTKHALIDRLNQIGADGSLGADTTR